MAEATPSGSLITARMFVAVWHVPTNNGSSKSELPDDELAVMTGPTFSHTAIVMEPVPLAGSRRTEPAASVTSA